MALSSLEEIYSRLFISISSLPYQDDESSLDNLTALVRQAISEGDSQKSESSPKNSAVDTRRMQWEYLVRRDVFKHAALEGQALSSANAGDLEVYYSKLKLWLDLALVFTELSLTDPSYTFSLIQDLLETHTIPSCSRIFDWIELRSRPSNSDDSSSASGRLTRGMIPQKGKALVLLRTLNDLLRRLSKAGRETIGFSGRILTFLSQVFPLGERSGVNLRGEYGPVWDMPEDNNRDNEKDEDFYQTFWSLQLPFSKPSVFVLQQGGMSFAKFQDSVDKVLPVIKEATAKERALMGSGRSATSSSIATPNPSSAGSKRKRDDLEESSGRTGISRSHSTSYFFAKFLTSPDLLDLEIADVHFRRQFLFQLLIFLTHLLSFTKANKLTWMTGRNRSLHMPLASGGQEWSLDDALILESNASTNKTAEKGKEGKDKDSKDAKEYTKKPEITSSISNPSASTATASSSTSSSTANLSSLTAVGATDRPDPILWVNLTISRTLEEIRQTQPAMMTMPHPGSPNSELAGTAGAAPLNGFSGLSGRQFSETLQTMLEREKGWIKWKNELCDAGVFERGRWEVDDALLTALAELESLEAHEREEEMAIDKDETQQKKRKMAITMYDATRPLRTKIRKRADDGEREENNGEWKWDLGTEALTDIWAMGYRELDDLERGFSPGNPRDFVRQLDMEDKRIEMRTKTLRAQQERILAQKEKMERERRAQMEAQEKTDQIKKEEEAKLKSDANNGDVDMKSAETPASNVKSEQQDVEMHPPTAQTQAKTEGPPAPAPIPVFADGEQNVPVPVSNPPSTHPPSVTAFSIPAASTTPTLAPLHPSLPPKPGSVSRSASPAVTVATKTEASQTSTTTNASSTPAAIPPTQAVPALPQLPPDEQIRKAEESKTRISWLALRAARDSTQGHLTHFGKIGTGDVRLLVEEIEKAERAEAESKEEREKEKMVVDEGKEKGENKPKIEEVKVEVGMEVDKGD